MLNILTRFIVAFILLFGAAFMLFTHDSGTEFPIVLFPVGMIISGVGSSLHGPMDPLASSFKEFPVSEKIGITLLFAGMIFMLLAAALKAFG